MNPGTTGLGARYRRLLSASSLSALGDGLDLAALPLLAKSINDDPTVVAGLGVALLLPLLLFTLPAGALVERWDKRRVMIMCDLLRAILFAVLAVLTIRHSIGAPALFAMVFLIGCGKTFFDASSIPYLPEIVDDDNLHRANGQLETTRLMGSELAGPPLGSWLFSIRRAVPLVADAVSFVVSAALLATLPNDHHPPTDVERPPLRTLIAEGVRWTWRHRLLRTVTLTIGAAAMAHAMIFTLFVLYSSKVLGLSDRVFGFLLAAGAVGGVFGGLLAGRLAERFTTARAMIGGLLAVAGGYVVMGFTRSAAVAAFAYGLGAVGQVVANVYSVTLRQQLAPAGMRSRVNSAVRVVVTGTQPLGGILAGVLAHVFGIATTYRIAGIGSIVATLLAARVITQRTIDEARAQTVSPRADPGTSVSPGG